MLQNFPFSFSHIFLIFFLQIVSLILAERSYTFELISYRHEINYDFTRQNTFRLINSTNHRAINGSVIWATDVDEFDVTITATITNPNGRKWTPLNMTVNGCEMIAASDQKNIAYLVQMMWKDAKKMSINFPKKCPIKKDSEIHFIDFYIDPIKIAPRLPDMKFSIYMGMESKKVNFYKGYLMAEIVSTNTGNKVNMTKG